MGGRGRSDSGAAAVSADQEQSLTWFEAPDESPSLDPKRAQGISARDLLVRFAFGAGTSAVAGVISVVWNEHASGVMLAFPAILAVSLTLIADEESRRAAREDARGAVLGGVGLAAFALVCYGSFQHLPPVIVLALALVAWVCVACGLYLVLWAPPRGLLRRN